MDIPESAFSAYTEVLENEPDSGLILGICKLEGANAKTANEVPSKHAPWLSTGIAVRDVVWRKERSLTLVVAHLLCRSSLCGGSSGIVAFDLFGHWLC